MPSLKNEKIGNVVVAIDTSGSISDDDISQFVSELKKISNLVEEVTVITCDCQIHETVKVRHFSEILSKIQMKGGGGTSFKPVFDKIAEGQVPQLLVYLTDTYGDYPEKKPTYPVLWMSTVAEPQKPPFGLLVCMK